MTGAPRFIALVALGAALAAIVLIARGDGSRQLVHVHFADAGQLIEGDQVDVGGVPVGVVHRLALTPDGLADVEIAVTDERFIPLRTGTTAAVGTVGLSGVTNRFVALRPGSGAPIPDGGVLPETSTRPIVDIDLLLDAFTPPVRTDLSDGVRRGSTVLRSNVAAARSTLHFAPPALDRADAFARALTDDRQAFSDLLSSGATVATTIADHEHDVSEGITDTATAFAAVARARTELGDALDRAPVVLDQASGVLAALRPTLSAVDPALRAARPAAAPLAGVLRRLGPTLAAVAPAATQLGEALPDVDAALRQLPPTAQAAIPALRSTVATLDRLHPVFAGLRPYADDIIQSLIRGLGPSSAFNYDANGQFTRIGLGFAAETLLTSETGSDVTVPTLDAFTDRRSPCPGGATVPARDGSSGRRPRTAPCDPDQAQSQK